MADQVLNQPTGQIAGNGQQILQSGVDPNAVTPPVTATPAPSSPIPQNTTPSPVSVNVTTPSAPQNTQTNTQTQPQAGLTMPANGSVVDLLNSAGQDSSFKARTQLAQQYGIQGYTGTAAQNQELSKKYIDAYNANKGKPIPANGAQASSALDTYFADNAQQPAQDPQANFFDQYMSLNPVVKNLYDTINNTLSSIGTQQTFMQQYQDLTSQMGIPALQSDLIDINNVMDGTEDDIRTEIQKAGGFATESQVQALTGARNKTLLKQANVLSQQLQAKEDYVNQVMQFSQADRAEVDKQIDQKLGLTQQLANMQEKITNAAKDNFNQIIQTQGYGGLYAALQGNPAEVSQVEDMLGLGKGGLKNLAGYVKPLTAQETLQNQNLKLQNAKLSKDINTPAAGKSLQFISGTANQPAGTFNPVTGEFTPIKGENVTSPLQLATAQSNIDLINNLLTTKEAGAVGPTEGARRTPFNEMTTSTRSNFIAGVQQLQNQLTLDNLQNAKKNGATFGALSEGELGLLASSASKLNSWAVKDKAGNVTGYNTDQASFKAELDNINKFAVLDYTLKGGDPTSFDNVKEMQDGTFWYKNTNGTYTQLK